MNKPLPWNVKGVGFDAREAARMAAKRAGMPLGEWLNGVISARAAELGVQVDDVEPNDRLEAIAARLSQDDSQNVEGVARQRLRTEREATQDSDEAAPAGNVLAIARPQALRRPALPSRPDPQRPFLERPILAAERSAPAARDGALDEAAAAAPSLAARRDDTASDRVVGASGAPATGAGRPTVRDGGPRPPVPQIEAAELDARLASILEKLDRSFVVADEIGAPMPPVADAAPRRRQAPPRAVGAGKPDPKADTADAGPKGPARPAAGEPAPGDTLQDLQAGFADLAQRLERQGPLPQAADAQAAASDLAAEIAALGRRIDGLRGVASTERDARRAPEIQGLRREMEQLGQSLSQLSPRQSLLALEAAVRELIGKMDLLRLDGVQASVLAPVERLSREMREAIRAADAAPAVEALRRDMAAMNGRLDTLRQQDTDGATVDGLRREMREMRESVEALSGHFGAAAHLRGEVVALGDRVGALAERASPTMNRDLVAAVGEIRTLLHGFAEDGALGVLDRKIDTLSARIDSMANARDPMVFLDDLARQIDRAHDGLVERLAPLRSDTDLSKLNERIGALSGKIDAVDRSSHDVNALYGLVGSLADRLDDAHNGQGGAETLTALQAQMGKLLERLDRTTATDTSLQGLERLIGDLFLQIEQSRNVAIDAAENAARAAAQDTLRAAMDNPALNGAELTVQTGLDVDHVSLELAELRRVQEASDRRVNTTLTALNTTLERLVDRLIADARDGRVEEVPVPAAKAARRRGRMPIAPGVDEFAEGSSIPAFDPDHFLLEPGSIDPPGRPAASAARDRTLPNLGREAEAGLSTEVAPLIAAARRAAQAAQASALEASLKVDPPMETGAAAAPGKTRSFFASKRRALLLGLAGLVLIAGTLQIVRLTTARTDDAGATATDPAAQPDGTAAPAETPRAPTIPAPDADPVPSRPAPPAGGGASLLLPPVGADKAVGPTAALQPTAATPRGSASDLLPAGLGQTLRDLAARGQAAAQYEVAARLSDGRGVARDPAQAFTWFQRAAQQGFAPAQYRLGSLYEKGVGVPADAGIAIAWYEKAAGQGNVRAMHNLAVMSAEGTGGKPDYGKAVTWFTKAASYGVRDSQFNLAVLFARGLGVPQSLGQSYAWFAVAAAQGDVDAVAKRDAVAGKLDAKALADAKATVASFRPLTPDAAANEVTPPPGGWDAPAQARNLGKTEARVSSM